MIKPKVIFKFDREKDIYNIWETCNKASSWYDHKKNVSKNYLEICEGKKFDDCKDELKKSKEGMYKSGFIELYTNSIQEAWNKINKEYFERLKKIMKKPICSKNFTGYITTMVRCPYNYKDSSFMVSFFRPLLNVLCTTGHEIMHIQFHNTYWEKAEKQIGKNKTADLKESLTALLNLEFKDLWFVDDIGYEPHKELRELIVKEWKKKPDFDILMNKYVKYLKIQK